MSIIKNNSSEPNRPHDLFNALQTYKNEAKTSIKNYSKELSSWFIQYALTKLNTGIERIQLLNCAYDIIWENNLDQQQIKAIFKEEESISSLIKSCSFLTDIAFILNKHLDCKMNKKERMYSDKILNEAKTQMQKLLKKNEKDLYSFFGVSQIFRLVEQKKKNPECFHNIEQSKIENMKKEAILIYNFLFKPIFQKRNLQNVYDSLHPMVMWFVVIKDNTDQQEQILRDMTKKMDSFLWAKKSINNNNFVSAFNIILDLLSVQYFKNFLCIGSLVPLLIKLQNISLSEFITGWYKIHPKKGIVDKHIQNILRNTLNLGCLTFFFKILRTFSEFLKFHHNYTELYYLFNSFIRKQYLSIKLPDCSSMKIYLNILMMYTIGFINTDRLDGQTQLDQLAINLSEHVCHPKFEYDSQCISMIIKFFRVYEYRFQFLSNTCRKFVLILQQIKKSNITAVQLSQEVANRIFNQFHANNMEEFCSNFDADHPMLERSKRYAGLENLGNTCYINSFMQVLFMTKKFRNLIIKAQSDGEFIDKYPISRALATLFRELSLKQNKTQINPRQFKDCIPEPFRSSWDQHDSGEFGKIFLDSVTQELKGTSLEDKINNLFTSNIQQKIYCNKCKTPKNCKETMLNFYLPVDETSNNGITVSDLWKKWFSGYQLDQNNKIFCEKCKTNKTAKIQPESVNFADNLIITLNIFRYYQSGSKKIKKPLNFQFNINFQNISNKIATDTVYQLYAFVLHMGTGIERGHYQCFARNLDENPMIWYNFDDAYVTQREIGDTNKFFFGQNETPYILFYEKSKCQPNPSNA